MMRDLVTGAALRGPGASLQEAAKAAAAAQRSRGRLATKLNPKVMWYRTKAKTKVWGWGWVGVDGWEHWLF